MGQQHKWEFRSRFRTNSFGWKASKLAVKRINEAVKEIRKVKDLILRAEGAILLLERLWPALQQVDSSSDQRQLFFPVNDNYNSRFPLTRFTLFNIVPIPVFRSDFARDYPPDLSNFSLLLLDCSKR